MNNPCKCMICGEWLNYMEHYVLSLVYVSPDQECRGFDSPIDICCDCRQKLHDMVYEGLYKLVEVEED